MLHQSYAVVEIHPGGISVTACKNIKDAKELAFFKARLNVDWTDENIHQDLTDYDSVREGDWAVYITPLKVSPGLKLHLETIPNGSL